MLHFQKQMSKFGTPQKCNMYVYLKKVWKERGRNSFFQKGERGNKDDEVMTVSEFYRFFVCQNKGVRARCHNFGFIHVWDFRGAKNSNLTF